MARTNATCGLERVCGGTFGTAPFSTTRRLTSSQWAWSSSRRFRRIYRITTACSWRSPRAGNEERLACQARSLENDNLRACGGAWTAGAVDEGAAHFVVPARQAAKFQRHRARRAGAFQLQAAAPVVRAGLGDDFKLPIISIRFDVNTHDEGGWRERLYRRNSHRQRTRRRDG